MKGELVLCLVALSQLILIQALSVTGDNDLESDLEETTEVNADEERRQIALMLLNLIDETIAEKNDVEKRRISGMRAWNKLPPSVLKSQGKRMRKLPPSVLFHH